MPYILTPAGWRVLSENNKPKGTKGLDDPQMKLLESLHEDGYLSEEQLDEGIRSFVAKNLRAAAEKQSKRAEEAKERKNLIGKALEAGRAGPLFGPKGTNRDAERAMGRLSGDERRARGATKPRISL